MGHALRGGLALAAIAVALLAPGVAHANPNLSSGSNCGLHAGKVIRRDSGGTIYRMRIGPRLYHTGGDMVCKGHVRKRNAKSATDGCCSINWQPFSLPNWRHFFNARIASTDITAGLTAASCQQFGAELAAVIISEGVATPALVIGGGGCIWGVHQLGPRLPGNPTLKGMRLIH
jgi:hypothetical protein